MTKTSTRRNKAGALQPSKVEQTALKASPFEPIYPPTEKIPSIIVDHFPMLGQLTALRFLEWVHDSPLIRATRGFVFLKEMDCEQFYDSCRRLRHSTEGTA